MHTSVQYVQFSLVLSRAFNLSDSHARSYRHASGNVLFLSHSPPLTFRPRFLITPFGCRDTFAKVGAKPTCGSRARGSSFAASDLPRKDVNREKNSPSNRGCGCVLSTLSVFLFVPRAPLSVLFHAFLSPFRLSSS